MEWVVLIGKGFWAFLGGIAGALAVVLALGGWLGRRWEARAAARERAHHATELERLKAVLARHTGAETDALTRRREVYGKLARGMRVFLAGAVPATPEAKAEFLAAYDTACIWAPDPVLAAVNDLLALVQTARTPPVSQEELKAAYSRSVTEMRCDAGFEKGEVKYLFVNF